MNAVLDHLDPANWFPHYDADSDRRAVPAFLLWEDPDLQGYLYNQIAADVGSDPWRVICGIDKLVKQGRKSIVVEYGRAEERHVEPDRLLYISNKDFVRQVRSEHLKGTFDELWAQHAAGVLTRSEFDARADALRQLRDYWTRILA